MNRLNEILQYNKKFVENQDYKEFVTSKMPNKNLVILSCMDTRLTELLPKALNLKNGDAKIIKNAGATISHPFGSIIRSIIVAIYEFNSTDVLVIGHHGCGMSSINSEEITNKMLGRGIKEETLNTLIHSGLNINSWLSGFDSIENSIEESVNIIRNHPLIPKDIRVHGLIMCPETGKLDTIVSK